jgi:YD repeat-containing protein
MRRIGLILAAVGVVSACVSRPSPAPVAPAPSDEPAPIAAAPAQPEPAPAAPEPAAAEPVVIAPAPVAIVAPPPPPEPVWAVRRIPLETRSVGRYPDGSIDQTIKSDYDKNLRLVAQAKLNGIGVIQESSEYLYAGDRLSQKNVKNGDGKMTSRRFYQYDDAGRLIGERLEDGVGKIVSTHEYAYGDAGERTLWVMRNAAGAVLARTVYAYADGRLVRSDTTDGAGKPNSIVRYLYAPNGDPASEEYYDGRDQLLRRDAFVYADGRRVQEERRTPGGQAQQRISYTYGPDGEVVRRLVEDLVGKTSFSYEYAYIFREERYKVEQ